MALNALQNETEVLIKFAGRDQGAFGVVSKQYYASLCYFANKFVYNKQEVEDIVE